MTTPPWTPPAAAPGDDQEPEPTQDADRRSDDREPPRRIWDPNLQRWILPDRPEARLPANTGEERVATSTGEPAHALSSPTAQAAEPPRLGHVGTAIVAGVVGAVLGVVVMLFVPGPVERRVEPGAGERASTTERPAGMDAVDLARAARTWVVNVTASAGGRGTGESTRSGSGVVIRPDGIVATSAALVRGADDVTVTLPHGRTLQAEVAGSDATTDIAVLLVPDVELPAAVLGTAEYVELAEPVVTVGAPDGIEAVAAPGSVAGVGRTLDTGEGGVLLDILLISGGSGAGAGAVVMGSSGSIIALTSAFNDPVTGSEAPARPDGAVYALPIDVVRWVAEQLLRQGTAVHPWIGVSVQPIDEESSLRIDTQGLAVVAVLEGPATSRVLPGDVIAAIDGVAVEGPLSLAKRVLERGIAEEILLRVLRGGEQLDVAVTIAQRPSP